MFLYRAPTPVIFSVSQPNGVCNPEFAPRLLAPITPPESERGLAAAKDAFLALNASSTDDAISSTLVSNTKPPCTTSPRIWWTFRSLSEMCNKS